MHRPSRVLITLVAIVAAMAVLAGCGGSAPTLTGQAWQWGSASTDAPGSETVIPNPERYTIQFAADGSFSATVDCNQVSGTYTTGDGGAMTITPGPSTMAACPADSMADLYLQGLQTTTSYTIADGQLSLSKADGGTMTLDPVSPTAS
jgi:heat shock protein HslJ